jgi:hypothetical protein
MCLFHKWGKWQQYDKPQPSRRITENWMLSAAVEHRQKKECDKCGKVKDEYVSQTVIN